MSDGAWVQSDGSKWDETSQAWMSAWGGGYNLNLAMTTSEDLALFTRVSGATASATADGTIACAGTTSSATYQMILPTSVDLSTGYEFGATVYAPSVNDTYMGHGTVGIYNGDTDIIDFRAGDGWSGDNYRYIYYGGMFGQSSTSSIGADWARQPVLWKIQFKNSQATVYLNGSQYAVHSIGTSLSADRIKLMWWPNSSYSMISVYIKDIYIHKI